MSGLRAARGQGSGDDAYTVPPKNSLRNEAFMKDNELPVKDMNEDSGSKNLPAMAVIFPVLSLLALLFVFWLGFSSFEGNSFDITRNINRTILGQSVSDIESATRYGKRLDSFFGMDRLLIQTANSMRGNVSAVVTDLEGVVLYSAFNEDDDYGAILQAYNVRNHMAFEIPERDGTVVAYGGYEILIMPIYGQGGMHSGNMCLIYPARDPAFSQEHGGGLIILTVGIAACVIIAILLWLLICAKSASSRLRKLTSVIPVAVLAIGILIQSTASFFTYQTEYRSQMLEGAGTVSTYLESLVSQVRDKGVPYDRMHGLDEFFADKLRQMPTLWDIKLVSVLANSQDVMFRENDYNISVPIRDEDQLNMRLEMTISSQYIDQRMAETLLLSFITLIVCLVAVVEVMRLPELIMLRMSKEFNRPVMRQWTGVRSGLRLATFLMYTGVYIVMPFSAMLVRQWQQTMLGLSLDVSAGIPLTMEVFALTIGTIVSAAFFKRIKVKAGLGFSVVVFIGANLACLFIFDPYWLSALRFMSGIGFSGILYTSNFIVSRVSREGNARSSALAQINSGLLGGIMVGASLGAIIASTLGVALCFVVAVCLCATAAVVRFMLTPWKLLDSGAETAGDAPRVAAKRTGMVRALVRPSILPYLLLVMMPLSLGLMFVAAGMPAFAESNSLSPLILSSAYIANGVAGIYLGLPLLKLFTRIMPGNSIITGTLVIGGAALAVIFLQPSWLVLLICALLLGIFDGIGSPTVKFKFLELPGIKELPLVDAMAAGSTFMRAVGTVSPLVLGLIITAAVQNAAVYAVLGGAFAAAGIIYLLVGKAISLSK